MKTRFYCLFLLVFLLFARPLTGVELVNENGINTLLLMPADPSEAQKYAVEEFARYVEKITGKKLSVAGEKKGTGLFVEWIRSSAEKMKLLPQAVQKKAAGLKGDAFLIDADKNGVRIIGRHDRALLYGTYRLLKEEGVMWLMPGEENEVVPRKKVFTVKEGVRIFTPAFAYRKIILNGGSGYTPDTYDWITRNGLQFFAGGRVPQKMYAKWAPVYGGGGHDLTSLMLGDRKGVKYDVFVKDLMQKHPEYFGLLDGKRTFGGNPSRTNPGPFVQVCTTNKDVLGRMVNTVKGAIKNFEGMEYARTFSGDDHTNWCCCASCLKADGKTPADKNGKISNRFWLFVNHMAKNLLDGKNPDLTLYAMVYQNYRTVPEGIKPDSRVVPIICPHQRCYVHSLTDEKCPANIEKFKEPMFDSWAKSPCNAVTFEYHTNLPANSYLPIEEPWIRDLKYYHKLKMNGFGLVTRAPDGKGYIARRKYLGENMWRSLWQLHYLTGVFAWDIHADYDKICEKINSAYYGKAWKEMKKYRHALRKYLLSSSTHMYYGAPYSLTGNVLDQPGALSTLEKHLSNAEKTVKDDPLYRKRVQKEKGYFERDWKKYFLDLQKKKDSDISVGRVPAKIVIDGREDEVWKKASPVHDFILAGREKNRPELSASMKVFFDENNLYFFLKGEKNRKGTMRLSGENGSRKLFTDSHFELMLSSPSMKGNDYQIAINGAGKYIQLSGNGAMERRETDIRPLVAVKDQGKYICMEICMPVKNLSGKIVPGDVWKINCAYVAQKENGKMEFSTICDGLFHGVPLFRNAVMGNSAKLVENADFELLRTPEEPKKKGRKNSWLFPDGKSFSSWRFSNANPATLKIGKKEENPCSGNTFMRVLAKGKFAFVEQTVKLPPKERNTGNYSFRIAVRGKGKLLVRLRGPKTKYYGNIAANIDSEKWENVSGSIRCDEKGYLVLTLRINGDLDLDSLRLVMVEEMKEEVPDSSKH